MKHTDARYVYIKIIENQNSLQICIEDDGKGLDTAHQNLNDSFGIIGIRERVYQWNGSFNLDSQQGKGVKLTITIPLSN